MMIMVTKNACSARAVRGPTGSLQRAPLLLWDLNRKGYGKKTDEQQRTGEIGRVAGTCTPEK